MNFYTNQIEIKQILELLTNSFYDEDIEGVIAKTLKVARKTVNADGVCFFEISNNNYLNLIYNNIESMNIENVGARNMRFFKSVSLDEIKDKNIKTPIEICAINKEIINSSNIYKENSLDLEFFKKMDENINYRTVSLLAFPLFDSKKNVVAAVALLNARNNRGMIENFTIEDQEKIIAICQIIAFSLERRQLRAKYMELLESFMDVMAKAIDEKSPYTGLHCQKVPIIAKMLASAAVAEDSGPLKSFDMSADEWYSLHIASWLHDCGKIVTPQYIMDKASKLETIDNRIHEIRTRFEVLRRDAHIEYLQKRLKNIDTKEKLQAEFVEKVKKLNEDFEFIGNCNIGDKKLQDEDIERLDEIAKLSYVRYFNRLSGLSWNERKLIKDKDSYIKPEVEHVLQDRPEQSNSLYDSGELHNLKIIQGTINNKERKKINQHIETTIEMLKSIPFPPELANVVEYAGCHHERVDGKGYPNGLKGEEMSIPAKIMAIADIYEALTAKDRPYKAPKKLSEILRIMQFMKNSGHIDPDLYNLFIKRKVYLEYAKEYVDKDQIDEINIEEFL